MPNNSGTNSGIQTIAYMSTELWDNIPVNLKELTVFNLSKQVKLSVVKTPK